jgi:RimJ/RimL family protein N-acetyltransferase
MTQNCHPFRAVARWNEEGAMPMFARTERLLLRPGFPEDASAVATAIGDESVVRNLAMAPWPYAEQDAGEWLAMDQHPLLPSLLMVKRTGGTPRIIGAIGIHLVDHAGGQRCPELGYWIARPYWGLGFATEAGRAVLAMARSHGLPPLIAGHFIDNPASGAVLRKLGFRPTGQIVPRFSRARGVEVPCALFEQADDGEGAMVQTDIGKRPWNEDQRETIRLMAA